MPQVPPEAGAYLGVTRRSSAANRAGAYLGEDKSDAFEGCEVFFGVRGSSGCRSYGGRWYRSDSPDPPDSVPPRHHHATTSTTHLPHPIHHRHKTIPLPLTVVRPQTHRGIHQGSLRHHLSNAAVVDVLGGAEEDAAAGVVGDVGPVGGELGLVHGDEGGVEGVGGGGNGGPFQGLLDIIPTLKYGLTPFVWCVCEEVWGGEV